MRWIRIAIRCRPEAAEPAAAALIEAGCAGIIDEPEAAVGYLPVDDSLEGRLLDLRDRLDRIPADLQPAPAEIALTFVEEEDWANAWKAHFHPIRIGRRLVVAPSWSGYSAEPGQVVVELDPGMAFGTGTHPTTQLCLRALEAEIRGGERVIDWGTGSGLLAIAAARLGAAWVVGGDVDPLAAEVARENVRLNGVDDRVKVVIGESPACLRPDPPADLVICNILAGVIMDLADDLAGILRPGGLLITSGIIDTRADEVARRLADSGLELRAMEREGEWVALQCRSVPGGASP